MVFDEEPRMNGVRYNRNNDTRPRKVQMVCGTQAEKSGRRNKAKISMRAVATVLESYGLDPAETVVKALQSGGLDPEVQARLALTLMEYVHPKLKSVEHKTDKPIEMVVRWADSGK